MLIGDWQDDMLPPDTARILGVVSGLEALDGYRLIGGTALALQVSHRISEDIDLQWPGFKLPRDRIDEAISLLQRSGCTVNLVTNETARLYWESEGADIDDHQQDWMIDNTKVTFVCSDTLQEAERIKSLRSHNLGALEVLDKEAIFDAKSRLLVARTTTRDLYDIWWFLQHGGHTIHDVVARMREANPHYGEGMIRGRLQPSAPPRQDSGVQPLTPGAPGDFAAVREALKPYVAQWEAILAAKAILDEATKPK